MSELRIDFADEEERSDFGVEPEKSPESIEHPFDPERIRVRTAPILIEQIAARFEHNEIELAPDFQRASDIWNLRSRSQLIESILLKIPLPVFYVSSDENENWSVVDGVQRLATIHRYLNDEFRLKHVEYLTNLEDLKYSAIPRPLQRRIRETQLIINVIEPGTPDEVMYNIFKRINTGGRQLNAQEIRHALNPGVVRKRLEDLATSNEFQKATNGSINPKRMADRECVLRFVAFYIQPWYTYEAASLDTFLASTMKKINCMDQQSFTKVTESFDRAMRAARLIFDKQAFRKPSTASEKLNPINMSLFTSWSVCLANLDESTLAKLVDNRDGIIQDFSELLTTDQEFVNSISYATGSVLRVKERFKKVQFLIGRFA